MQRREFITLIAARWHGRLQRVRNSPRCLSLVCYPSVYLSRILRQRLREGSQRGVTRSKNVTIERRWARGNYDKLPELAQELVRLNPALIRVGGNAVALAARRATSTIPIVSISGQTGEAWAREKLRSSRRQRHRISMMTATLTLKRLELSGSFSRKTRPSAFW